jgi:hypothetical protein
MTQRVLEWTEAHSGCANWVSAGIAMIAFLVVPLGYLRQRRQHQLETALNLIEQIQSDPMASFAITTLDWGTGLMPAPERWKSVVSEPIAWEGHVIHDALRPKITPTTEVNTTRLLYRHAFVALFNHLERIGELVDKKVLKVEDLRSIAWLCHQLDDWDYAPAAPSKRYFDETLAMWYPNGIPRNLIDRVIKFCPKL